MAVAGAGATSLPRAATVSTALLTAGGPRRRLTAAPASTTSLARPGTESISEVAREEGLWDSTTLLSGTMTKVWSSSLTSFQEGSVTALPVPALDREKTRLHNGGAPPGRSGVTISAGGHMSASCLVALRVQMSPRAARRLPGAFEAATSTGGEDCRGAWPGTWDNRWP